MAIQECDELCDARGKWVVGEAAAKINISDDIDTYLEAIAYLDEYMKTYPDDTYVPVRRRLFMDEYYNIQLANIKQLVEAGETGMARSIAEKLVSLCPERDEAKEYMDLPD